MSMEIEKYKDALKRAIKKINELDERLAEEKGKKDIAIIGYNCRFPEGANNSEEFWNLLSKGYDAVTEIKSDRFNINEYYSDEKGIEGKTYTKYASFLNTDIKEFDYEHFDMTPKEAISVDPQQRLLLEVSWEAIENAGLDVEKLKGSKTGVFVGIDSMDYAKLELLSEDVAEITPYSLMGVSHHSAAGRMSYFYDFKGPAVSYDTACSSSIVALNSAVESLKNGQCDLAIVGGVNLLINPETFIGLSQLQGLSPDGRCKTFDKKADGFGRGEGCGVMVLKRLEDAQKDGNKIEALIKGIYVGQDGKSNGFYAPNGLAEERVIKEALKLSGLSVNDIDYIEAHGTGTVLGDSIESKAICDVFKKRKEPILVGSVKSNIGHLEAAAGMAGIIKVLLSMKHKQLPPSINIKQLNPDIDWNSLKAVTNLMDWKKEDGKRRAGVSAFGISGTLAHVILEEADDKQGTENKMKCSLITISGKSEDALKQSVKDIKDYINDNENLDINDIAYSTNIMKSHLKYRFALEGSNREELLMGIEEALSNESVYKYNAGAVQSKRKKIAFLFTGQGSIYMDIAKEFYENSNIFRESFDSCEKLFKEALDISIKDIFEGNEDILINPIYSQSIIFSVEYSLTKVWSNLGIKPDVVIGHSIGEYAAACYSGIISLEDAVKMISARATVMRSVEGSGKMMGILTDAETMQDVIIESGCKNVSIAAVNAPKNVTISGYKDEIDAVINVLHKKVRTFINDLNISQPFHSVVMKNYENQYLSKLDNISFSKPVIRMISTVTGHVEKEDILGNTKYWSEHLSKTVNYNAAIKEARNMGVDVFIEIGGTATLSGLAEQCLDDENMIFVPSMRKGVGDYRQLCTSLKVLYLSGVDICWNKFYENYKEEKLILPNYPFKRRNLWKKHREKKYVEKENLQEDIKGEKTMDSIERKYNKALSDIVESVHVITGMDIEEIDPDKELVAFGFDSLLLASLGKQLKMKYDLELSLANLFTSLNTLSKIAGYIAENCYVQIDEGNKEHPEEEVALSVSEEKVQEIKEESLKIEQPKNYIEVSKNNPINNNVSSVQIKPIISEDMDYSSKATLAGKIFENQFALMHEQNNIIMNLMGANSGTDQSAVTILEEAPKKESTNLINKVEKKAPKVEKKLEKINPDYYVPFKKPDVNKESNLEALQLKYMKNIENKYTSLTKKSKEVTQKYRSVYASNRNSAGFRPALKEMIYQIIVEKGQGSHIIDIDGNDLIDLTMGFGVNLFGHAPKFVKEALENELKNGMPVGPMGRLAGEVARQISELTGVERVFFTNSGTEADMFALRVARAITGKNKVVAFRGSFHGHYDGTLGVPTYSDDPDNATLPMAPGITENAVKDLILLEYNSEESLKYIEEHSDIIAAVLTEPVQSRRPDVQPKEFLRKLRKVTEENNVALIFDEIITGFRIASGGAQEYFGVKADIVTYGKVIGGGMPIGVISGKAKYLDSIDGGMWNFGDDSVPTCNERRTFVAGTFCHHPMAMAAANAALKYIKENKDTLYPALNAKTDKFVKTMNAFFDGENVPLHLNNFGSLFRFNITLDKEIFYYGLLEKGVYIWEGRNCFFSTEHNEEDINKIMDAIKQTVHEMKEAGYFGNFNDPTGGNSRKNRGCDDRSIMDADCGASKEVPMSIIQQRLHSHMMMTESDPYDIISAYKVNENLDIEKIEDVINKIIARHEILRTALYLKDGEYKQKILNNCSFKVREITLSSDIAINDAISNSITKFDLAKPPLLETLLITAAKNEKIIVFHFHHTAADGMSMNLFVDEFSKLYQGIKLPELQKQYKDFVVWEQNYLNSDKFKEDSRYWIENLSSTPKVTAIPYDYIEPENTSYPGNTIVDVIDADTLKKLKDLAKNNSVTLFMVLLAAVSVLVHKTTREDEIAISTPVTNRFEGGFEECIGMFTNTIIMKNNILSSDTFSEVLNNTKISCLQSYEHSNYPFNELIRELNLIGNSAFKTEFVYENVNGRGIDNTGLGLEDIVYIPSTQEADITFELLESNNVIDVYLRYRTDLFKEESIRTLLERFNLVINQIIEGGNKKISDINIITEKEKELILSEFNDSYAEFDKTKTIVDLFEEQVEKTPDNIALIFEDKKMTYRKLNEKANILASRLRKLGAGPDSFVAIVTERSMEMIIAIYAVIKSGSAYVPILPSYPKDRIQYMISDCKPKAVLTYKTEINTEYPVINLEDKEIWTGENNSNLPKINSPENILYLIYTSGTTGRPKAVMVEHRNVVRLLKNSNFEYDFDENDVWMMFHSYCFDFSVWEMYGATLNGAKLLLISNETAKDSYAVAEAINKNKVTVLNQVPSAFYNLMALDNGSQMNSVRYLIFGGESLNPLRLRDWHKTYNKAKIVNMYGITETTVHVTYREIGDLEIKRGISDIGKAIPTLQVYVMNGDNLCGIGIPGELCIIGDGVARGYLNNPVLTSKKFVKNPFGEGRMYRSGDLARWLPDGNIEYLGRIDEQVKVRGFRIELGEIENRLREISNIDDVAVIVRKDQLGDAEIYAYVVSDEEVDFSEIKIELQKNLPDYMIPAYMMQIDKIPVTRNGKLDKKALPKIDVKVKNEYKAPTNKIEEILCVIFQNILGVERVGIKDSFFELGGHSLRATMLLNQIEAKTGYKIPLKEVFNGPTVEELADVISKGRSEEYTPIPKADKKEYYPMSSTQKRTYLICQMQKNSTAYNMPGILELKGKVNVEAMKNAVQKMIDRHEILRTQFLMDDCKPVQKVLDHVEAQFEYEVDNNTLQDKLICDFVRPFDLSKAPLIRVKMVERKDCTLLLIDTHHIISDGMSMEIFTREMTKLYNGEDLKPLTCQYKDYSEWMNNRDISSQKEYWVNQFSDEIPVLDMPLDYNRPQEQSYNGNIIEFDISSDLCKKIKRLSKETGTTEYMIFLSSLMILLSKYSRQEDIVVGSVISGRTHKDTESMLGMFVNTLAMRGKPEGNKSYLEFLSEIKEVCLKAYENQEYPFEELISSIDVNRDMSRNPLFDVMLALQNNEKEEINLNEVDIKYSEYNSNTAKFDLTFDIKQINDEKFNIELGYCQDLYKEKTAENILKHYIAIIQQVVDNKEIQLSEVEVITDYEKDIILNDFNNTLVEYPQNKTISELFEEQVNNTPNNTAIVFEDKNITYSELNKKANALANKLRELGVEREDFVAIIAKKSLEVVIGICGIVKCGAAYVPIDASYPEDRINYILNDCKPKVLLLYGAEVNTEIPIIDLSKFDFENCNTDNPSKINEVNDLAYVIYTSGTTGKPKGVMVEQKSVIKLVKNCDYTNLNEKSVILQTGQLAFDASTFELWGSFLNGGRLNLLNESVLLDAKLFKDYIIKNNINTMFITTALFNQMVSFDDTTFDSLDHLMFGGEASSEEHIAAVRDRNKKLDFRNVYGPTETTTFASHYIIKDKVSKTPIGKPISNTQIYVLNQGHLCGIGVPGELCIAGDGVARGYLNRPELTAEKFSNNPFGKGKMYHSGDLVRWLPDGNIEYIGRIDAQVKIRGFRIELGEIESAIRLLDGIKDCRAIVRNSASGDKAIYAYIVSENKINMSEIRNKLSLKMPQYMIPAYMMQIESIPVTKNGKLDKGKLPDIELQGDNEYVAPENEMQGALCSAFEEVLGIEKVGIEDNFFELGGDSLKAIRVISRVRELGYTITVQNIMQYQVVKSIALVMHSASENSISERQDIDITGEVPFGAIQELFVKSKVYNKNHFNMSAMFEVSDRISESAMIEALKVVVKHHDMLRVNFEEDKQIIKESNKKNLFKFNIYDLKDIENEKKLTQKIKEYISKSQDSIDLVNGPVMSVTVFNLKDNDHIHICINHFVVDAMSMRIISEDIFSAYYYANNKELIRLPQKTTSFKEWISYVQEYKKKDEFKIDSAYWNKINEEVKEVQLNIKRKNNSKELCGYIGEIKLEGLTTLSSKVLNVSMDNILMAAVSKAMSSKYETDKMAVNVEGHGRYEIADDVFIDRTVGWFTSIYPLIIDTRKDLKEIALNISNDIKSVQNKGMAYLLSMAEDQFKNINIPQVTVNYLGNLDVSTNSTQKIKISKYLCGEDMDKKNLFLSPMSINVSMENDNFRFNFVYDKSLWNVSDIKEIFKNISNLLIEEINANETKIQSLAGSIDEMKSIVDSALSKIDEYVKEIVSNTEFKDYPITGIQKISYQFGATNAVIDIPFFDKVDMRKFNDTWIKLNKVFDVLRSSIYLSDTDNFIRIYDLKEVDIPFIDISSVEVSKRDEIVKRILDEINCYERSEMYTTEKLSSMVILIKTSETSYRFLMSCSHQIFDRFSSEVLKNKLIDVYYNNDSDLRERSYKDYYELFNNDKSLASEEDIVKQLELENFYKKFDEFYEKNKLRKFKTYNYLYSNAEKWSKLTDKELLSISHTIFVKAMQYIFKGTDIPLLTLHIARKNKYVNLFDYVGEFLDVIPICIKQGEEVSIEHEIEEKIEYVQENDLYFSSLLFSNGNKYTNLRNMLSEVCKKSNKILIYNNTGILKSANNVVVNSEKYRIVYNVMSVVINSDGIYMNVPIDDELEGTIKEYLDSFIDQLIER